MERNGGGTVTRNELDREMVNIRREMEKEVENLQNEMARRAEVTEAAIKLAREINDKEVALARKGDDAKQEKQNEIREQLNDQARTFVPLATFVSEIKAIEARVAPIDRMMAGFATIVEVAAKIEASEARLMTEVGKAVTTISIMKTEIDKNRGRDQVLAGIVSFVMGLVGAAILKVVLK